MTACYDIPRVPMVLRRHYDKNEYHMFLFSYKIIVYLLGNWSYPPSVGSGHHLVDAALRYVPY